MKIFLFDVNKSLFLYWIAEALTFTFRYCLKIHQIILVIYCFSVIVMYNGVSVVVLICTGAWGGVDESSESRGFVAGCDL